MREAFIVLDFETTGLEPDEGARATEVAAVLVKNGHVEDRFHSLMNAGMSVPPFIQALTGISDEMVAAAPPSNVVMRRLANFIGNTPLVAHNASFDRKFLDAELSRIGLAASQPMICSMRIARRIYQNAPNHKLKTLVEYADIEVSGVFHRALADAEMTAKLMLWMAWDIRQKYGLQDASFELMKKLQSMAKHEVAGRLRGHTKNKSSN
jgi:DNA polymerase-3 subunit epsilon